MTTEKPTVSIIISVFEQLAYTKKCLEHLQKTLTGTIFYEVLIVDDASNDGTKEYLLSLEPPYRVFFNNEKKGFAKNNNLASREAVGKFLCFLNNDVFVQGNWLLPMIEVLKKNDQVGMVGNVQRLSNSIRYDHMGVVFAPEGNPRHYGQGFYHRPFKGQVKQWSAVTAACCVTESETFHNLGGFNEIYLNGCEDVDLCLRMNDNGLFNYVVHDSVVIHVKGASEGRKLHNDKNAKILLDHWGSKIRLNQSILDQRNHAKTYAFRGFFKPWSINFSKWIESILILFRIKTLNRS